MDTKILAICDIDCLYAQKMMEALLEKKFGFQIYVFSGLDELEYFLQTNAIELLLLSGGYMSEKMNSYHIGKIILLSDGEVPEQFAGYESIYKYQSVDRIMKEMLSYYADYTRPVSEMYNRKDGFEIYGIYSPVGRCGKSALAEALASKFGKLKKTLLLDLQSFSAVLEQRGNEEIWDLSDMIYFLRQGKNTFMYKLESLVQNKGAFDYILPMKTPADLRSVTYAEWSELLDKLLMNSNYHVVVIDFGYDISSMFQLLGRCTRVYSPMPVDLESKIKMENFENFMRIEKYEMVISKIQKILLPADFDKRNSKVIMEEWVERFVKL